MPKKTKEVVPAPPMGFVVKDKVSGKIYSGAISTRAKAKEALKKIEAKERKEHPVEAEFDFVIVESE